MFYVLLHPCVSMSPSYKLCFAFLGSCDQNLGSGGASILAYLRESPSAWPGILILVLQRAGGGHTRRADAPSHLSPAAWEPERGWGSLALGEVQRGSWELQLECLGEVSGEGTVSWGTRGHLLPKGDFLLWGG